MTAPSPYDCPDCAAHACDRRRDRPPRGMAEYVWARPRPHDPWAALDARRPGARAKRAAWEADRAFIAQQTDAWLAEHPEFAGKRRTAESLAYIETFNPRTAPAPGRARP